MFGCVCIFIICNCTYTFYHLLNALQINAPAGVGSERGNHVTRYIVFFFCMIICSSIDNILSSYEELFFKINRFGV